MDEDARWSQAFLGFLLDGVSEYADQAEQLRITVAARHELAEVLHRRGSVAAWLEVRRRYGDLAENAAMLAIVRTWPDDVTFTQAFLLRHPSRAESLGRVVRMLRSGAGPSWADQRC